MNSCLSIPAHCKHVDTLPCENLNSQNRSAQEVIEANCHVKLSRSIFLNICLVKYSLSNSITKWYSHQDINGRYIQQRSTVYSLSTGASRHVHSSCLSFVLTTIQPAIIIIYYNGRVQSRKRTNVVAGLQNTLRLLTRLSYHIHTQLSDNTHTHTRLPALCQGLPGWAGTSKVKPIWI